MSVSRAYHASEKILDYPDYDKARNQLNQKLWMFETRMKRD